MNERNIRCFFFIGRMTGDRKRENKMKTFQYFVINSIEMEQFTDKVAFTFQ